MTWHYSTYKNTSRPKFHEMILLQFENLCPKRRWIDLWAYKQNPEGMFALKLAAIMTLWLRCLILYSHVTCTPQITACDAIGLTPWWTYLRSLKDYRFKLSCYLISEILSSYQALPGVMREPLRFIMIEHSVVIRNDLHKTFIALRT